MQKCALLRSYLLFIENFHGKVSPGFRATFPLDEHHPAKRAGAERFDPLVIVEGGCVGARRVPFALKVFLCFLEELLNCETREEEMKISWERAASGQLADGLVARKREAG